ncbi:hypothetical protein ElyMa_002493900 [Elysia marginata]|uniref:Uncharacterized protein n=1 Tax=Elysia marginata TaxID=1093978 RepID=A0AAV4GP02_9GAST|nr:hypothetical protein ElyMa_002493900 [Elysia marginata]
MIGYPAISCPKNPNQYFCSADNINFDTVNDGESNFVQDSNHLNGKKDEDERNNVDKSQTEIGSQETYEANPTDTAPTNISLLSLEADEHKKTGKQEIPSSKFTNITPNSHTLDNSNESVKGVSQRTPVQPVRISRDFSVSQAWTHTDRHKFTSRLRTGSVNLNHGVSRMSVLSKTSYYDHGDIVDENLLLSAARIDSTLLRLFSRSRDGEETKKALQTEDKLLPFLNYSDSDLISMDAVLWRVHPMESAHKETLEQEMSYLEENVKPVEILRRLYMDEVLTHMDYNTITR